MIEAIRCDQPSFKTVEFGPGFNVVLADRTKDSTKTDSRNGLGKTTLIEIIHFCLGANALRCQGVMIDALKGWRFSLDMRIDGRELSVTRSTADPRWFHLEGDVDELGILDRRMDEMRALDRKSWNATLGRLLFGLDGRETGYKYHPTFRDLISYPVRRNKQSYVTPFAHTSQQPPKNRLVSNAFLLGLSWEQANQLNELGDEQRALSGLRKAAQEGLLQGTVGTLGNLEADRTRLDSLRRVQIERLNSFRVHADYTELEEEANSLTSECHRLANANQSEGRLLDLYHETLQTESEPDTDDMLRVYRDIGRVMPNLVTRRLSEVRDFHRQIVANRREYLRDEIQRIERNRERRGQRIREIDERRAQLLGVLSTHGALQEHVRLRELHLDTVSKLSDVEYRITNLRRFEEGQSDVKVRKELHLQDMRRELLERQSVKDKAVEFFDSNFQALYSAPGDLVLEVTESGFRFEVEVPRSGSQGVGNMKIFCYDLTVAQLWSSRRPSPGLLIHDSTIFDGVDERQMALALELAQREAESHGFQYVCALNSDTVPHGDFSEGFDLEDFVKLRLTNESEEGGLLGIRC